MRFSSAQFLAVAGLALLACGDDGFSPTVETVAGDYQATTLTATQATGTVNLLQGGGSLMLTLLVNGGTTGRLFIPGGGETGEDLDVDLTGSWTLTGSTVTFLQPGADTFIRDMTFTAGPNSIRGEETFPTTGGDITITVVLTR